MSGGFEWSGYASQPLSGLAEALDAAGIDCYIPHHDQNEGESDNLLQRNDPSFKNPSIIAETRTSASGRCCAG